MTSPENQNKPEETKLTSEEKQKRITAHKQTATHLQTAAQHHLDAVKHHEENNTGKATKSNISALDNLTLTNESQKENTKHYINNTKK